MKRVKNNTGKKRGTRGRQMLTATPPPLLFTYQQVMKISFMLVNLLNFITFRAL